MAIVWSQPQEPPSTRVISLIRRLLAPDRKQPPSRADSRFWSLLDGYRKLAREGQLRACDASWIDTFLNGRETWFFSDPLEGKNIEINQGSIWGDVGLYIM